MKKQDTAAFSLIRCDTEKKAPTLAVRPCCALFRRTSDCGTGSRRDLDKLRLALGRRRRCGAGLAERGAWTPAPLAPRCASAALPDLRSGLFRALPRGSHYGQQRRVRDADEGHGTYPPAAGRSGSGRGTFCGYFGSAARHALCLCCPLVADRLRPAADGAVCGTSGAAQAGCSAGLDGGVPAVRGAAAGRRRGRSQRIRSDAFELWRTAGSGRRACGCAAGCAGTAQRYIVLRMERRFQHGAAPAPV